MVVTEESVQTLMRLGLSSSQSKVYLNLVLLKEATVNTAAKVSSIDRGETYRVMSKLIELGLIEKIIDSPVRFKPIPLKEGFSILLDRRKRETSEIQRQTQRLLADSLTMDCGEVFEMDTTRTLLVPSGDHLANLLAEKLAAVQKTYDVITFLGEFDRQITECCDNLQKLLARGVTIRSIVENPNQQTYSSKAFQRLQKNPNFKVKFVHGTVPTCMGIYDGREVRFSTAKKINIYDSAAYWSDNHVFISLAKSCFERIWNS
jgi:sugar-specific transcriptional regulator TrmB